MKFFELIQRVMEHEDENYCFLYRKIIQFLSEMTHILQTPLDKDTLISVKKQ